MDTSLLGDLMEAIGEMRNLCFTLKNLEMRLEVLEKSLAQSQRNTQLCDANEIRTTLNVLGTSSLAKALRSRLEMNGICTLEQLTQLSRKDILSIRHIGEGTLRGLVSILTQKGIEIPSDWTDKVEYSLSNRLAIPDNLQGTLLREIFTLGSLKPICRVIEEVAGVFTVEQLIQMPAEKLLSIWGFCGYSLLTVYKKVIECGFIPPPDWKEWLVSNKDERGIRFLV